MTWTPAEAEQILREMWDGAEEVGGFCNDLQRVILLKEIREEHGDAIMGFTLIGQAHWSDYEEGGIYTLWVKDDDQSLWIFEDADTVYGSYGDDFASEIHPGTMEEWLSFVESCAEHDAYCHP